MREPSSLWTLHVYSRPIDLRDGHGRDQPVLVMLRVYVWTVHQDATLHVCNAGCSVPVKLLCLGAHGASCPERLQNRSVQDSVCMDNSRAYTRTGAKAE